MSQKHNVRIKSMFEMTEDRPGRNGKTTLPLTHSCGNHGVIQVGSLGSSDAMFEVVETSVACFVHLLLQYAPHAIVNRI